MKQVFSRRSFSVVGLRLFAGAVALVLGATLLAGCTSSPKDKAFTQDWLQNQRQSREIAERQRRIEEGPLPFGPGREDSRAGVRQNEQGCPAFRLGEDTGLSAGVDADRRLGVRYGLEW